MDSTILSWRRNERAARRWCHCFEAPIFTVLEQLSRRRKLLDHIAAKAARTIPRKITGVLTQAGEVGEESGIGFDHATRIFNFDSRQFETRDRERHRDSMVFVGFD